MTGRYPQRTGITDYINASGGNQPEQWKRNTRLLPAPYSDHLALEERTIAEALRDAGYATFFAGKWHLGGEGILADGPGLRRQQGRVDCGLAAELFQPVRQSAIAGWPAGRIAAAAAGGRDVQVHRGERAIGRSSRICRFTRCTFRCRRRRS